MNKDLIKRIEDKILDTLLLAQEIYKRNFELPKLSFNINSTRIAGRAFYSMNEIALNPRFLKVDPEYVINQTLPHEIAHLVCDKLYPNCKQHHGPEWKSVASRLGIKPERCHTMELPEARPFTYICSCQKFHLSRTLHNRIQSGHSRYCKTCKKYLVFVGKRA